MSKTKKKKVSHHKKHHHKKVHASVKEPTHSTHAALHPSGDLSLEQEYQISQKVAYTVIGLFLCLILAIALSATLPKLYEPKVATKTRQTVSTTQLALTSKKKV